jgi:hypothetical protein
MNTNAIYSKGSLMKEMTIANLVRNQVVDGVVQEGQASYTWTMLIEKTNALYESNGGAGNKVLDTYKDEVAYTGDPTIQAQIVASTDIGGGRIKVEFANSAEWFRANDYVGRQFGRKLAEVSEAYSNYIIVQQAKGYDAITTADFPTAETLTQFTRSVATRGTKSPVGLSIRPEVWYNYISIIDDAVQQNLFDSKQNVVIEGANGYIKVAPVGEMMERFFRNCAMNQFVSQGVNPEDNNFNYSATRGIHQQIRERGLYTLLGSQITKSEFENYVRRWYVSNPGNDLRNKFIATGAIGMAQIAEWYKDQIKFDAQIAMSFTDGSINGLNATKIFIPGFEFVNVVHLKMLNQNGMGSKTTISGFESLPKTSGSFYLLDFNPVMMRTSGRMAPAFQNIFFGGSKYYYSYQKGLSSMDSLEGIVNNATPLTMENLELTSTDADFSNLRIYTMKGINVMNPTAQGFLENNI